MVFSQSVHNFSHLGVFNWYVAKTAIVPKPLLNSRFISSETSAAKEDLAEAFGSTPSAVCGGELAQPLRPAHEDLPTTQSGSQPRGPLQWTQDPSLRWPRGQPAQSVWHQAASPSGGEPRGPPAYSLLTLNFLELLQALSLIFLNFLELGSLWFNIF